MKTTGFDCMRCGGVGTYGLHRDASRGGAVWHVEFACTACMHLTAKHERPENDGVPLPESLATSDSPAADFALYEAPGQVTDRRVEDDLWRPSVMWSVEDGCALPMGDVDDAIAWLVRGAA